MASIKRNFFYNILLNVTNVIFPLVTAPYVARVLDPDGLGLANFANSYAAYFAMVAALGSKTYSYREIAKHRNRADKIQEFVSEIFSLTGINTLIVSLIFIISVLCIPQLAENKLIFILAGFVLYLTPLKLDWYFIGMEKLGVITSRSVIIRIVSICCLFLFVKNKSDLYIYVLLSVLSSMGGIVWNVIMLYKDKISLKVTAKGLNKHYKPLLILFSSSVAVSIYTMLDSLMLGFLSNYNEVGYYSSASTISRTLLAVVTSLSAVAVPRVAYYMQQKDYTNINALIIKSINIVAFLAFPMTIGVACIAPRFTTLFLGEAFQGAIIPMIILAFILIATGLNNITGMQILIGMGFDKLLLYSQIIGAGVNLVLNFFLIPKYGATGAACASVLAELIILGITIYFIKKYTQVNIKGRLSDLWKAFIGVIPFVPVTILIYHLSSGWISVIVTMLLCSLLYAVSQYMLKSSSYMIIHGMIVSKVSKLLGK